MNKKIGFKLLTVIMVLSMILSLAACSSNSQTGKETPDASKSPAAQQATASPQPQESTSVPLESSPAPQIARQQVPINNPDRYVNKLFEKVTIEKDIQYGEAVNYKGQNEKLLLDVFTPQGDEEKQRPAILWVHGGGFTSGSKDYGTERNLAIDMAKRGYVCLSINYRLRSDLSDYFNTLSDAVSDTELAVAWAVKNSEAYGIDPTHIAVAGYSAGAFTVINLCYNDTKEATWPKESIFSVIDIAGNNLSFGDAVKSDPPCLILHGDADNIVAYRDSQALSKRLQDAGVTNELITLSKVDHDIQSKGYYQVLTNMIRFLYKEITGKTISEADGTSTNETVIDLGYSTVEYHAKQVDLVLDGKLDEWGDSAWVTFDRATSWDEGVKLPESNDFAGKVMLGWNAAAPSHLYLATEVTDDYLKSIHDGSTNPWENDTLQIMIDYSRNGKVKYSPIINWIFDYNGKDFGGYGSKNNMDFRVLNQGDRYTIEATIDLSDKAPTPDFKLSAGDFLGAGITCNDYDEDNSPVTVGWAPGGVWESTAYVKVVFDEAGAK